MYMYIFFFAIQGGLAALSTLAYLSSYFCSSKIKFIFSHEKRKKLNLVQLKLIKMLAVICMVCLQQKHKI